MTQELETELNGQFSAPKANEVTEVWVVVNGQRRQIPEACSVADLLESLEAVRGPVAVEVNGTLVTRNRWGDCLLKVRDQVEIVHFVGGG